LEGQNTISVELLILMGSLGMVVLAVSVILFVVTYQKKVLAQQNQIQLAENRHQRELLDATLEVAEQEREKIAKNIHDDVGTLLNVIKLHLTKLSRNPNDKELADNIIRESMGMMDETIQTIRGISQDLMPPTLVKLGLEKGVAELCRQINASAQVNMELSLDTTEKRLPPKVELQLYRVIREVINNMLKHSQASTIRVQIRSNESVLTVVISHDGLGITNEAVTKLSQTQQGIGLKSIQSRIQLIKASIQYLNKGNKESEVFIEVPFTT
jgi:two-component system, NarL family, sensor kinase